ncbi:kinase-like domain-containing protein [Chlamydoabsidia padenii]|nr:kinase-like domain-containing protein [Chlamydoabsidia padenii]
MHSYSTSPKDNNEQHFYNYFKGNNDDGGSGLHIDTLSLGIGFHSDRRHSHHQQQQQSNDSPLLNAYEPTLSPTGSPSSSSSSAATSPALNDTGLTIPHTHHRVARNKSIITRKSSTLSPQVTCQSWEHLKSPAASFLASFASPSSSSSASSSSNNPAIHRPFLSTYFEEQAGDEIDDYVMNQIIGYGGFSTVRKGYCISNGQTVAIKIIKKNKEESSLKQELDIWQTLDHDHLVRIQKVLETDYATYVVCDYCSNGTLLQHLLTQPSLAEQEKKRLFLQLCHVVDYLHRKCNVIHKDIKLDNILLDDDMNIKLCDFGLAVYQQHSVAPIHLAEIARPGSPLSPPSTGTTATGVVGGSLAYCAPEQIKSTRVLTCPKTDVWSLGVVLFAMFAGRLPFDDDYDVRLRSTILQGHYEMPDDFSPLLADLISHCLQSDPCHRFSLDQVYWAVNLMEQENKQQQQQELWAIRGIYGDSILQQDEQNSTDSNGLSSHPQHG